MRRGRAFAFLGGVVVLAAAGLAIAALAAWPAVRLERDRAALARFSLPGFAGSVSSVVVRTPAGVRVPAALRHGRIWPTSPVASGTRLTVRLTVRRPGWAGWLVGRSRTRSFVVRTPAARLLGRYLEVKPGAPVTIGYSAPVRLVSLAHGPAQPLERPTRSVAVGVTDAGAHAAGRIAVAAAARSWERLPPPVTVNWFPARADPQVLVRPAPGGEIALRRRLVLTFSRPVADVLGGSQPRLEPAAPGTWHRLDDHTIAFQPSGFGYGFDRAVRIELPRPVELAGADAPTETFAWRTPGASMLRLQQLLAELGYLPLRWQPDADPPADAPAGSLARELEAAVSPPAGHFTWRYPDTPPELRRLWRAGQANEIVRGAVMTFEQTHGLDVDAVAGPHVWSALLRDAVAGRDHPGGYSFVFVHSQVPESLNLWHDGRVILRSPGNTGIPAAPTQLGTYPVFEHIPIGTMSGTNPDGTHYHDPGIRWISYFHHGEAIHAFTRASYGTPQSLGCVELPLAAAARVWPYTPIGTLVTIER